MATCANRLTVTAMPRTLLAPWSVGRFGPAKMKERPVWCSMELMTAPDAVAGSDTALDSETLFCRYASFVASFLLRLGAPPGEVEDLVQEVFLTAHRRGGYRPGSASPRTFLARISLEARLAYQRRDARWRTAHRGELAEKITGSESDDPERVLDGKRAAGELQRVLDAMEPGARAVFILFELQGESCVSIAAGLDLKIGTVYSRLHKARSKFLDFVRENEPVESAPAATARRKQEAP
jgi:RNA polymerase sigma-70 factor (ECF subfamily)